MFAFHCHPNKLATKRSWLKTTHGFISRLLLIRSPSSAWFSSAVSSGLIRSNSRCVLGCVPLWRLWGRPHFLPHSGLWENPVCSSCRAEVPVSLLVVGQRSLSSPEGLLHSSWGCPFHLQTSKGGSSPSHTASVSSIPQMPSPSSTCLWTPGKNHSVLLTACVTRLGPTQTIPRKCKGP